MIDTTPEIEEVQRAIIMSKSPADRLRMGCSMFSFSKILMTSAILRESSDISPARLRAEIFRRFYADDFEPARLELIADELIRRWS